MIDAHEVTNVGSGRDQLSSMAKLARDAIASETLSVLADRSYFNSEQILACHDAGITAYVCKPMTSGAKGAGRFNNDAFVYDTAKNEYICPALTNSIVQMLAWYLLAFRWNWLLMDYVQIFMSNAWLIVWLITSLQL